MLRVDAVAEKCNFAEEAQGHKDADGHYNLNEHFSDEFGHCFLVDLVVDPEEHFLLKVGFSGSLLVDEFLRDFCLFFARNGPVEVVFEGFGDGLDPDDYSPEWLRHVFFDLNVRA